MNGEHLQMNDNSLMVATIKSVEIAAFCLDDINDRLKDSMKDADKARRSKAIAESIRDWNVANSRMAKAKTKLDELLLLAKSKPKGKVKR
jgi:hypothetical protein